MSNCRQHWRWHLPYWIVSRLLHTQSALKMGKKISSIRGKLFNKRNYCFISVRDRAAIILHPSLTRRWCNFIFILFLPEAFIHQVLILVCFIFKISRVLCTSCVYSYSNAHLSDNKRKLYCVILHLLDISTPHKWMNVMGWITSCTSEYWYKLLLVFIYLSVPELYKALGL